MTTGTSSGATSSVYLNKSNPTRHVTRIPINKVKNLHKNGQLSESNDPNNIPAAPLLVEATPEVTAVTSTLTTPPTDIQTDEEPYYDAIPDMPEPVKPKLSNTLLKKRQQSPPKQQPTEPSSSGAVISNENKEELVRKTSEKIHPHRIKKKSQRSSSLGPLLDEPPPLGSSLANTNSLESIDSNPRQKLPKGEMSRELRERLPHGGRIRATGAVPRKPLTLSNSINQDQQLSNANPTHIGKSNF